MSEPPLPFAEKGQDTIKFVMPVKLVLESFYRETGIQKGFEKLDSPCITYRAG